MSETKHPDYTTMVRETMGDLETKRGLVAAELQACEGDLRKMRGEFPGGEHAAAHKRGSLALEAVLGDENAADELEPSYLESVWRFNARRRDPNREAWVNFHLDQAGRHRRDLEDLIARHEREAEKLKTSDERKSA